MLTDSGPSRNIFMLVPAIQTVGTGNVNNMATWTSIQSRDREGAGKSIFHYGLLQGRGFEHYGSR